MAAVLTVVPASGATIVNGDFSATVTSLADITLTNITTESADTWLLGGNDGPSDFWSRNGTTEVVVNGTGAEAQAMIYWSQNDMATTGVRELTFDLNYQSGSGDHDLGLYVFGWNTGDTAPSSDLENGTLETADSFVPNGSVNLITAPTGAEGLLYLINNNTATYTGVVNGPGFQGISVDVNFGTGYDF